LTVSDDESLNAEIERISHEIEMNVLKPNQEFDTIDGGVTKGYNTPNDTTNQLDDLTTETNINLDQEPALDGERD
jgi:hypothetical protein